MTTWTYSVKHGGLVRCCLGSLDEQMEKRLAAGEGPPRDGEKLATSCCDRALIHRDGAWEWAPSLDSKRHSA